MGGIMFIVGIFVAILAAGWQDFKAGDFSALIVFAFALVFGIIGFIDDFRKVKFHKNEGLDRRPEVPAPAGGGHRVRRAAALYRPLSAMTSISRSSM